MGELRNIRDDNPLAFFVPAGFDYILKVLTVCPDAARSWSLVQFYFGTLHWYTAVGWENPGSFSNDWLTSGNPAGHSQAVVLG